MPTAATGGGRYIMYDVELAGPPPNRSRTRACTGFRRHAAVAFRALMNVPLAVAVVLAGGVSVAPAWASSDEQAQTPTPPSAEETRLDNDAFRTGLKKRGLTELLQRHLEMFPPATSTESLLMMRDVRLEEFADKVLPRQKRRQAVAQANRILERLIREFPDDLRRFQWRYDLAHSLIYDEAEPHLTNLLYHGGSGADRERLLAFSTRAVDVLRVLATDLAVEYDRVDHLAIREYGRVEATGYIERIDQLAPRAHYLQLWALFYNALPRQGVDPTRARLLNRIVEKMEASPAILKTPHSASRVQVQALVLSGMTHRRLNRHHTARQQLDRALGVAERLTDPSERQRVEWAVTLAWVESIRNNTDDLLFADALAQLARFRTLIAAERGNNFKLQLVAAILKRSVHRRQAEAAQRAHRETSARKHRRSAWKAVSDLARRLPDRRDEIYATLYDLMEPSAEPQDLDPFEQCALIAGLLFDANQGDGAERFLRRAIEVGTYFLESTRADAQSLVPEVLYNTAVALYRLGRPVDAARRFLEIARDHSAYAGAQRAATVAVQLGADLYNDPALRSHPEVEALYSDALEVLVTRYDGSEAAGYWRFHYARWLDESDRYEAAATEYERVEASHEHYLESAFARVRCLALVVRDLADQRPPNVAAVQRQANTFFSAHREFVALGHGELNRTGGPDRASSVRDFLAQVRLMAAEVQALPPLDRTAEAVDTLDGFEDEHPGARALLGRLWRVRLLAFERLGRIEEAKEAIPRYIAADPLHAVSALQSLYETLVEEAERLKDNSDGTQARRKEAMALVIATQLHASADRAGSDTSAARRRTLTVQLGEAHLRSGHFEQARDLLAPLVENDEHDAAQSAPNDLRVAVAYAEAEFRLGHFAEALPAFNRLATALPPADGEAALRSIRWKSLLRDLQCRTRLGHPPDGIIKVINQQHYLYPELGGPALAQQFEKLKRENERRGGG